MLAGILYPGLQYRERVNKKSGNLFRAIFYTFFCSYLCLHHKTFPEGFQTLYKYFSRVQLFCCCVLFVSLLLYLCCSSSNKNSSLLLSNNSSQGEFMLFLRVKFKCRIFLRASIVGLLPLFQQLTSTTTKNKWIFVEQKNCHEMTSFFYVR